MMIDRRLIAVLLLIPGGCASNRLRLDRADSVAAAGHVAVIAATGFVARVRAAREDANATIVASEPSCAWADTIVVAVASAGPQRPFCVPAGSPRRPGDFDYPLTLLPAAALRPTLATIEALAAYLDAVNRILDDHPADLGEAIGTAYVQAHAAGRDLAALTGTEIVPALSTAQTKAIADSIKLIDELVREQRKVDALRRIVIGQRVAADAIVDQLIEQVERWGRVGLGGSAQVIDNFTALEGYRLGEADTKVIDFEARRRVIDRIQSARRGVADAARVTAALVATLREVKAAHAEFIDGLAAHPHWSAAERRRAAALNRQRLLVALHGLATVAAIV